MLDMEGAMKIRSRRAHSSQVILATVCAVEGKEEAGDVVAFADDFLGVKGELSISMDF